MAFAESPPKVIIAGGPVQYYVSYSTTNLYVEKTFGAQCSSVTVQNTHATDPIQISFDGATLAGDLSGGESIQIHLGGKPSVYLKSTGGTAVARVWAW